MLSYSVLYSPVVSLPSRGAWIEIQKPKTLSKGFERRSPHGERGLKFVVYIHGAFVFESLPSRGAWIEIFPYKSPPDICIKVAPLTGSVD